MMCRDPRQTDRKDCIGLCSEWRAFEANSCFQKYAKCGYSTVFVPFFDALYEVNIMFSFDSLKPRRSSGNFVIYSTLYLFIYIIRYYKYSPKIKLDSL
ncbi:hypothetical protein CLU79DRAFT_561616 [Phycomyces nitens]|nr:hypothetical protein CLU79DRAFT_561616 [Phycomyces nitens]